MLETQSNLDCLPAELLMTALLPYLDKKDLKNLSKTCTKWQEKVTNYLVNFKGKFKGEVSINEREFFSAAENASNLVKLELIWNTDSKADNECLDKILNANINLKKLHIRTTANGWLSPQVITTMALKLEKLRHVSFSSSRIKLYSENGESRKLKPCTCWGKKRDLDYFDLDYSYSQQQQFKQTIEEADISDEKKLLFCLRLLAVRDIFQDYSNVNKSTNNLLDPLVYHENICSKGLLYEWGNNIRCFGDEDEYDEWVRDGGSDSESDGGFFQHEHWLQNEGMQKESDESGDSDNTDAESDESDDEDEEFDESEGSDDTDVGSDEF